MSTAAIEKVVRERHKQRQAREADVQRSQIRIEVEAELAAKKIQAERAARYQAGEAAAAIVRADAPYIELHVSGTRVVVILGAGDQTVAATAIESVTRLARSISGAQRGRVATSAASGTPTPFNEAQISGLIHSATLAAVKFGVARIEKN